MFGLVVFFICFAISFFVWIYLNTRESFGDGEER
jgi:hypothetical protein